jgi:hypothetical protein
MHKRLLKAHLDIKGARPGAADRPGVLDAMVHQHRDTSRNESFAEPVKLKTRNHARISYFIVQTRY